MVINIKDRSEILNITEKVSILIKTMIIMMENGSMENKMDTVSNNVRAILYIKATGKTEKCTDKDNYLTKTEQKKEKGSLVMKA